MLTSKFVILSGGNLSDFNLSKKSVWRQRVSTRREQSESIKAEWLKSNPRHLIIQNFIALFYAKYFLRSRIAIFALHDDFKFIGSIISYREDDHEIATAVLSSIKRHLWYLCEEFVVLSLLNENISSFTRGRLAQKLLSIQRPVDFKLGKPKFTVIDENNPPDLALLLGPRSWLLFSLLGLKANQDWLGLQPKYWRLICKGFLSSTRSCQ